jgi:hypothetical protein
MVSVLSLTMVACGSDDETTAYCVDGEAPQQTLPPDSYQVVDDDYCDEDDVEDGTVSYGRYFWYYGGQRSGAYISGGSRVGPSDGKIRTAAGKTLSRGGFGGSGKSGS